MMYVGGVDSPYAPDERLPTELFSLRPLSLGEWQGLQCRNHVGDDGDGDGDGCCRP